MTLIPALLLSRGYVAIKTRLRIPHYPMDEQIFSGNSARAANFHKQIFRKALQYLQYPLGFCLA